MIDFAVETTAIPGLMIATLKQAPDPRGPVREFFRRSAFADAGVDGFGPWQQVNITETLHGAIRGMHAEAMHKLVGVVSGTGFGAYVDLRPTESFGTVVTVELVPGRQVLVPPGVGNGFQATSEEPVQYLYCFDAEWEPGMAGSACNPLDPDLGIDWPVPVDRDNRAQVSEKDANLPTLYEVRAAQR
jgi:dTDP-4-dehydrorhamnose 3,5-epimerase